ncbi:AIF_collapsed_G0031900.mRNA.1.CDS.1 [Saccharomyces cerevisiae]|nr:AIF_collapsed_G0031900.mRNA.1.CDS.1 [Saccharomyces cerevisiae]
MANEQPITIDFTFHPRHRFQHAKKLTKSIYKGFKRLPKRRFGKVRRRKNIISFTILYQDYAWYFGIITFLRFGQVREKRIFNRSSKIVSIRED